MEPIKVYVSGADTTVVYAPVITAGTVGQPVQFSFDKAWDGLTKTAVFHAGDVTKDRVAISGETTVPAEVLAPANAGSILQIGVYGTDAEGKCVIPSRMADVDHIQVGADPSGDEGIEPELPVWQQALVRFEQTDKILQDVENTTQEARDVIDVLNQAYENGEFVGPQGEPGPEGPQGPKGEPGNATIDDGRVSEGYTWSAKKIDEEMNLRGGGRFGKYDAKTPGWKRILNIIRATSGTLNVGLVQPSLGYSMVQYAMLDIGGCVNFHNRGNGTGAKPIIRQRMNHVYGENPAILDATRQAKITKVRIAYPKRGTTYPIPDSDGDFENASNPINCYVDVYLDFDPEWKSNGYDVIRSFIYNFSGMVDSHNCTAITEEVDATDTGMYGEELEFFEYELKEDTELDAQFNKVTAKTLYVTDAVDGVVTFLNPTAAGMTISPGGINVGARGLRTNSGITPNIDTSNDVVSNNTALGWGCEANASATFAACVKNVANAWGASAFGGYTVADIAYIMSAGLANASVPGTRFVVGNGSVVGGVITRSNAFEVYANGNATVQNVIRSSNGADYAEFFEWLDGNSENEDRVGLAVCLEGDKIRLAQNGDDVLGIISGTAAVLGDSAEMHWKSKYLTDEYGRMLFDMVEEFAEVEDPETKETRTVSVGIFPHPRMNPDYNPEEDYVPREERPEWDKVGLLGKIYTRDDGTCTAGGYGCVGKDGVLTCSEEKTDIRIMKRTGENIVLVLMK